MADNDGLSGLDTYEVIKLLFKNYMNCTSTSDSFEFYQENLLSNHSNIFSSGVLTDAPPKDPSFQEVSSVGDLETYLKYSAIPDISINDAWFNDKTNNHGGKFYVDSTSDESRTILKLERIRLDYLRTSTNFTSSFVCTDLNGTNILQNLVPFNYSSSGCDTQLEYENDAGNIKTVEWLKTKSELQTTCEDNSIKFGGALLDVKNGVVTFYDVSNAEPENVFPDVSSNFFLTVTKYIGSTLADGATSVVNTAGQTFHEVVTGAPQTFTMGDISSTLFTIDISWSFEDIQPTESNRLFNFPLPNKRDRVIPYMSHIYFDISSSTGDIIDFSANIEIDSNHNYAEDSKEVSGNIDSSGGDLSYNLTYRTLKLTKFSEDTRTYTVNVWGVNESNESDVYTLPFVDISFVPDSEAVPTTIDYSMNTYETISGDFSGITDSDGNIVRFMIDNSGSIPGFTWDNSLSDTSHKGITITTANYSSDGQWTFSPGDTSGNTTITIRTWTDFYVNGQGISAEFYSDSDVSGFSSTIDINIFVDAEANVDPTSDTSGISHQGEVVTGIVYANDSDGAITFSISGGEEYPDGSGLWQYHTGDGSANIVAFSESSAEWEYTPESDFSGNDTFFIRTTDTSGGTTDISINIFVDAEANFNPTIDGTYNTSDTSGISQTNSDPVYGIVYAADTDGDISFSVVSSFGGTDNSLNISTDYGASAEILSQSDVSAEWKYTPVQDFSGNDTFFIRTTDTSGGTTDISINIFVDAEANFNPTIDGTYNTSDTSGISQTNSDPVYGIVYAADTDGDISFSVVSSFGGTDNSLNISTDYGASAEILSQSGVSAEWKYTPVQDWSGNDYFFIRTTDISGGITDISINIFVDAETSFSHDPIEKTSVDGSLVFIGDINETITGRVYATDTDGDISFSIGNYKSGQVRTQDGSAEILDQSDSYVEWKYTPDTDFSGNDTFTIQTTDTSGGTTDIVIKVIVSVFYEIAPSSQLGSDMKSVHSGLLPLGGSSTGQTYNYNSSNYSWFVYKVDESETSTEYLPSEKSSTGTAGINLSHIMKTQFGDSSENAFSDGLETSNLTLMRNCESSTVFESLFNVNFSDLSGTFLEITSSPGNTTSNGKVASFTADSNGNIDNYGGACTFIIKYKIENYPNDSSSAILYEIGGNTFGLVIGFSDKSTLVIYGGYGAGSNNGTDAASKIFEYNIATHEVDQTNIIGFDISFVSRTNADFKLYFNNALVGDKYSHELSTNKLYGDLNSGFGIVSSQYNQFFEADADNVCDLSLAVGSFVGLITDGEYTDHEFSGEYESADDILVYIVATRKLTGDYYMARISNLSQGPGFDEMNPWYWKNKVTESSLSSLTSGSGSGALPSTSLQAEIRNNDNTSTVFETDNDSDVAIYAHSNVLQDHYFYFAFKK